MSHNLLSQRRNIKHILVFFLFLLRLTHDEQLTWDVRMESGIGQN